MSKPFYRIKHLPSGLYYIPSSGTYGRENLHKVGKIYILKPSVNKISFPLKYKGERLPSNRLEFAVIECIVKDWSVSHE